MAPEQQPSSMQNVWTFTVELGHHKLDQGMAELAEKITRKQDECHEMGMLATVMCISHDVSNVYGQGMVISAILTVTVAPLAVTATGTTDKLMESLPEP